MLLTIFIVVCYAIPIVYFVYSYLYLYQKTKVDKKYSWYALGFITFFFCLLGTGLLLSKLGYW